jgi:aldehyde dehydrogenase (NAD+)
VVGQVISWSSPLLMLAWQIAPALACGNTVILKPSEATPLTALAFAEICRQADLPPGVVNVVTGDGTTGQLVAGHPGLDKVAFTGSAEVGKEIAKACALSGKPLTLKLGGTAVNIVCADADIEAAAGGIVAGVFVDQGHVCCAGSRVLVETPVRDELVAAVRRRMSALRMGDPLDVNTDIGAVISRAQLDKITELVASGEAEGARPWSPPCPLPDRGFWFPPTAFTEVADGHGIGSAELAGPVLTISTFDSPAEAVERAGGTRYGLAAGVWTQRGALAGWLASRLRTGVVWTNAFNRFDPAAPFGGYREAGFGREGGRHGLEAYLDGPAADVPGGVDV